MLECSQKGEGSVTYEKPEMFLAPSALQTIQGSTVKPGIYLESNQVDINGTASAYEADE